MLCDIHFLPLLAAEVEVEVGELLTNVARKRIQNAIAARSTVGTKSAVSDTLASLGINARIQEGLNLPKADGNYKADGIYYAGGGAWSDFVIYVETPMSATFAQKIKKTITSVAPVRSRLHALIYASGIEADGLYLANGEYNAGAIGVKNV